jgi:putative addiction module component (TIGR02574 family)
MSGVPDSVDGLAALLAEHRYLADPSLATVLFLALRLGKPVLLEGEAGVGKTEVARTLAAALDRRLIRLQCYEGLDAASAVYEWNFARQMLEIRLAEREASPAAREALARELYGERFLLRRPLLDALGPDPRGAPVVLIDELDRTDEPFEAFLLEFLADFQVTIPELGTIAAAAPPIVILTSNRTREIHDAIKRRCLYHWIDYPDAARELAILTARAPEVPARLAAQIVAFVQRLRASDLSVGAVRPRRGDITAACPRAHMRLDTNTRRRYRFGMSAPSTLLERALALPARERAELVDELTASLEVAGDVELERAWAREIELRVARLDGGTATVVDGAEVFARLAANPPTR